MRMDRKERRSREQRTLDRERERENEKQKEEKQHEDLLENKLDEIKESTRKEEKTPPRQNRVCPGTPPPVKNSLPFTPPQ